MSSSNRQIFLARRTAVLGMTRTGKSNTVKTTVSSVALAAMVDDVRVGQLIFDVNGEYANANHQDDGSSIADVFPDITVRYRAIDTPGFEDLRTNFFNEVDQALNLIQALFRVEKSMFSGQDLDTFLSSTLEEPEENRFLYSYALGIPEGGFPMHPSPRCYVVPQGFQVKIPIGKDLMKQCEQLGHLSTACLPVYRSDLRQGFR